MRTKGAFVGCLAACVTVTGAARAEGVVTPAVHYRAAALSFVGWGGHAPFDRDRHDVAALLVLPLGFSAGLEMKGVGLALTAYGPGLNVLGFAHDERAGRDRQQCVSGRALCGPVLGAADVSFEGRFTTNWRDIVALTLGVGTVVTSLGSELYWGTGIAFGVKYTPSSL